MWQPNKGNALCELLSTQWVSYLESQQRECGQPFRLKPILIGSIITIASITIITGVIGTIPERTIRTTATTPMRHHITIDESESDQSV